MQTGVETFLQGSGVVRVAGKVLTDAQIKALPTTAIEIIPAPGANRVIQPIRITGKVDATAGAYVLAGHTILGVIPHGSDFSGQNFWVEDFAMGNLDSASQITLWSPFVADRVVDMAAFKEKALDLFMDGGGSLTGGNAANTLTVIVFYSVMDV